MAVRGPSPWLLALGGVSALLAGVDREFGEHWFNAGLMLLGVGVVVLAVMMSRGGK